MRERNQLEQSLGAYRDLESELDDGLTLLELGEAEDDEASVEEAEGQLVRLQARAEKLQRGATSRASAPSSRAAASTATPASPSPAAPTRPAWRGALCLSSVDAGAVSPVSGQPGSSLTEV